MITNDNKEQGRAFEQRFKQQAQQLGLLAIKQDLSAKYIGGGGVKAFKGDLDFKLIDRRGNVAFVDCKSFEGNCFTFSMIDSKQLEKALMYNDWAVPSGFVIYHRASGEVVFYSGRTIDKIGPRKPINAEAGIRLGPITKFNLRAILPLYEVEMHEIQALRLS